MLSGFTLLINEDHLVMSILCGAYERYPTSLESFFACAPTPAMSQFTMPVCSHAMPPYFSDMPIMVHLGLVDRVTHRMFSLLPVYVSDAIAHSLPSTGPEVAAGWYAACEPLDEFEITLADFDYVHYGHLLRSEISIDTGHREMTRVARQWNMMEHVEGLRTGSRNGYRYRMPQS